MSSKYGKMLAPPPPKGRQLAIQPSQSSSESLVFMFDELTRNSKVLTEGTEEQFLQFAINQEFCRQRWEAAESDVAKLRVELDTCEQEVRKMVMKLEQARDLLANETNLRKKAEQDRDFLNQKWELVKELLGVDNGGQTLNDDTRMRLQKLEASFSSRRCTTTNLFSPGNGVALSPVNEIDSTASILDASDLSFDHTQGSILGGNDESRLRSGKTFKRKSSGGGVGQAIRAEKRNRSSGVPRKSMEAMAAARKSGGDMIERGYNERNIDQYIASAPPLNDIVERENYRNLVQQPSTVTLTPSQTSTSTLVSNTPYTPGVHRVNSNSGLDRKHKFVQKNNFKTETCGPCQKRIKFGKVMFKCSECRSVAHPNCRDQAPLPCVPTGSAQKTPSHKGVSKVLSDFTPPTSPMVPAIIVHCLNEVEARGLGEVGVYRVPGSEREVKDLRDKFRAGRGCPNLGHIDIHVLCGVVKDFFRSLREPLIPNSMWKMFTRAAENPDMTDGESDLYQAISELPQPNRDTLAFLMLHLQKVSLNKESKMNVSNLAKILGPTIVGYSSLDPQPEEIMREVGAQASTMERLLNLDGDYWSSFLTQVEVQDLYKENFILSPMTPEPSIFRTPIADNTGFTPRLSRFSRNADLIMDDSRFKERIFASPELL